MARLYIKVDENNNCVDHPHFENNLRALYPEHDFTSGPPSGWKEFVRVSPPIIGAYQKFDETKGADIATAFPHNGLEYKLVGDVFKDVWTVLDMTDAEKLEKQNAVKNDWAVNGFASWTFNEDTCKYDPPVEKPTDGKTYRWDEATTSWVEVT